MASSKELAVLRGNTDMASLEVLENILRTSARDKEAGAAEMAKYQFGDSSGSEAQANILDRILDAKDDDELENIGQAEGWQSHLGIPMEIHGFRPLPSEKEGDGPPFYLLCDLTSMITGDNLAVSIGSWGVIGQLINMAKRDQIPGAIRILEKGETTKKDRNPLRLVSTQREKDTRMAAKAKERL